MMILSFIIGSDFKYDGKKTAFYPANRSKLFRFIRTAIDIMRVSPNRLDIYKVYPAPGIVFKFFAFTSIKFKPHVRVSLVLI